MQACPAACETPIFLLRWCSCRDYFFQLFDTPNLEDYGRAPEQPGYALDFCGGGKRIITNFLVRFSSFVLGE